MNEQIRVEPLMIDYERMHFVHFNALFAHLFWRLSKSQSMSKLPVDVCKLITVPTIMDGSFPALKSTNNERTPMVSTRTVGYIHGEIPRHHHRLRHPPTC